MVYSEIQWTEILLKSQQQIKYKSMKDLHVILLDWHCSKHNFSYNTLTLSMIWMKVLHFLWTQFFLKFILQSKLVKINSPKQGWHIKWQKNWMGQNINMYRGYKIITLSEVTIYFILHGILHGILSGNIFQYLHIYN